MENIGLVISLGVFGLGAVLLGLGSFSFKFRAVTNKKAWDGKTKPLLLAGLLLTAVGIGLVYLTYPR
jgi:NADH:ubiquinone oxidoreductase subunit 2 (subunit N)